MVRFKFLVFTVVVVCAWVAQLVLSAPVHSEAAVNDGLRTAEHAGKAALARRGAAVALVERVGFAAARPDTLAVPRGARLPAADRLTQLRDALSKALSSETRGALGDSFFFGFVSPEGQAWSRGIGGEVQAGEGAEAAANVDVAALAKVGPGVSSAAVLDSTYSLLALPIFEKGSIEPLGTFVVGAPVAQTALAGATLPMALIEGDNVQGIGGIAANGDTQVKQWLAALGSADKGVIERSAVDQLGPVLLPFFTAGDALGGKAARTVAVRQSLEGSEVVVFAPVDLSALAAEQKKSLMTLGGLLAFALLWTLLMGSGAKAEARSSRKETQAAPEEPVTATSAKQVAAEEPSPEPAVAEPPPEPAFAAAEASPEDFQFGTSSAAPSEAPAEEASAEEASAEEPSAQEEATGSFEQEAAEAREEPNSGAAESGTFGDFPFPPPPPAPPTAQEYDSPGVAGSLHSSAPVDPNSFAYAAPPAAFPEDDNPEATRVAAVPAELLAAAAHAGGKGDDLATMRGPSAGLLQSAAPSIAAAAGANPDDAHFQEVFREFIETRERCGETPDSLTFEKFAAKLRKNKDQLMLKHNCKTVRFQVYVKEGKAALKATPVAR